MTEGMQKLRGVVQHGRVLTHRKPLGDETKPRANFPKGSMGSRGRVLRCFDFLRICNLTTGLHGGCSGHAVGKPGGYSLSARRVFGQLRSIDQRYKGLGTRTRWRPRMRSLERPSPREPHLLICDGTRICFLRLDDKSLGSRPNVLKRIASNQRQRGVT